MPGKDGEIVMVTGASGFLGQHIIKQLLEQGEFLIKEVMTFDLRPFTWCPELEVSNPSCKLTHIEGDLLSMEEVRRAFKGVTVVIHTAGVIDVSPVPDSELLRTVNIQGSENVLQACIHNNIQYLVYTSTVDVVIGQEPITGGTETTLGIPQHHHFGLYATTKYEAEKIVLKANNLILQNSKRLQTCALRPTPLYGEGDVYNRDVLQQASLYKTMVCLGNESSRYQCTYAGNIAWGHILAVKELVKPTTEESPAGQAFFLTDETPVSKVSDFFTPFVIGVNAKMSSFSLPFWLLYSIAVVIEICAWLLQPIYKIKVFLTTATVSYVYGVYYFQCEGAERCLGYEPLYTYDDAVERSLVYYRRECGLS
ncbi:3 beta-hydroxysteroid dehydrogenase type 7-like [Lytechinus variegatus]|uniref:3 beta-hydroxysteroid dehydrogenase type 7-like n=1 Tax=Lytechinus variegatus TaxID=7654 RepID=UPI001BB2ACAB|nr:3 beta-hydroxysteroid dehydrogenase type 7-like [Lytechinus variegatus]